jgi:hypothetical protein
MRDPLDKRRFDSMMRLPTERTEAPGVALGPELAGRKRWWQGGPSLHQSGTACTEEIRAENTHCGIRKSTCSERQRQGMRKGEDDIDKGKCGSDSVPELGFQHQGDSKGPG